MEFARLQLQGDQAKNCERNLLFTVIGMKLFLIAGVCVVRWDKWEVNWQAENLWNFNISVRESLASWVTVL